MGVFWVGSSLLVGLCLNDERMDEALTGIKRFLQGVPLVFKENHGFTTSQIGLVFACKLEYRHP